MITGKKIVEWLNSVVKCNIDFIHGEDENPYVVFDGIDSSGVYEFLEKNKLMILSNKEKEDIHQIVRQRIINLKYFDNSTASDWAVFSSSQYDRHKFPGNHFENCNVNLSKKQALINWVVSDVLSGEYDYTELLNNEE